MGQMYFPDEVRTNNTDKNGCSGLFWVSVIVAILAFTVFVLSICGVFEKTALSIDPLEVSIGSNGGNTTLSVTANRAWEITDNDNEWLLLSKNGNNLELNVGANNSLESRSGYFEVSSRKKTFWVYVTQDEKSQPFPYLYPDNIYFSSDGGTQTIDIIAQKEWKVSVGTYSWGHLTRNGDNLTLTVVPSDLYKSRDDYFKVKSGSVEKTFRIMQGGTSLSTKGAVASTISCNIDKIWAERDFTGPKQELGARIHVVFDVSGMLNVKGSVAVYFYGSDGTPLKDTNGIFTTSHGEVATHEYFEPPYENSTYTDFTIFMPYSELHLSKPMPCSFSVSIWNENQTIARSGKINL